MKIKNLIFILCIAFVAPALVADQTEVEIQLVEISGAGFLPGDNPLLFGPQPQKTFENGMLLIRKNGNTYNVNGTKVE